jgi:NADP-dependent 3-hydroxy acid dehydrogenase YdfG
VADLPSVDLVLHCAGGAKGMEPVVEADLDRWRWMYETNVLGVVRVTKALLPRLRDSVSGHVVVMGSIAGSEVYPGGGGYVAAKHATRATTETLRWELHAEGIRVSEVAPGMVQTDEFALVRFDGDAERAAAVYAGTTPVTAEDVAEVVAFVATRRRTSTSTGWWSSPSCRPTGTWWHARGSEDCGATPAPRRA